MKTVTLVTQVALCCIQQLKTDMVKNVKYCRVL